MYIFIYILYMMWEHVAVAVCNIVWSSTTCYIAHMLHDIRMNNTIRIPTRNTMRAHTLSHSVAVYMHLTCEMRSPSLRRMCTKCNVHTSVFPFLLRNLKIKKKSSHHHQRPIYPHLAPVALVTQLHIRSIYPAHATPSLITRDSRLFLEAADVSLPHVNSVGRPHIQTHVNFECASQRFFGYRYRFACAFVFKIMAGSSFWCAQRGLRTHVWQKVMHWAQLKLWTWHNMQTFSIAYRHWMWTGCTNFEDTAGHIRQWSHTQKLDWSPSRMYTSVQPWIIAHRHIIDANVAPKNRQSTKMIHIAGFTSHSA